VHIEEVTIDKIHLITDEHYELYKPAEHNSLLILFPCLPCDAENTRQEFDIDEQAAEAGIAVLRMNYNMRLWMEEEEKIELTELLEEVIVLHGLNTSSIVIGGFSGGGNVSLLMADYLKARDSNIAPKGLFVVDSPIDLLALYKAAHKSIAKDFSKNAVAEANWIVNAFDAEFGVGDSSIANYEQHSPYISTSHSLFNLSHLQEVSVRFYTEPDTLWWRENRQTAYEDMNACYLSELSADMADNYGPQSVALITTEDKGYRSNGERHPHSWSIVDKSELISWVARLR
jgi:hypothetical protein